MEDKTRHQLILEQFDIMKSLLNAEEKELSDAESDAENQRNIYSDEYKSLPGYEPFSMPREYDLNQFCLNLPRAIVDKEIISKGLERIASQRENLVSLLKKAEHQDVMEKASECLVSLDYHEQIYRKIAGCNREYERFLEENHLLTL